MGEIQALKLSLHKIAVEVEKLVPRIPNPKLSLEQYTTPGELAATIAWDALIRYPHLLQEPIADLGCGTGRILAAFILAGSVGGACVEADPRLTRIALESLSPIAEEAGSSVVVINSYLAIERIPLRRGCCGIIASNPPFGVWKRGSDRVFLEAGLSLEPRVYYAILKSGNLDFHKRVGERFGYRTRLVFRAMFPIPASMRHHRSRIRRVAVDVIAFERETRGAGRALGRG